MQVRLKQNLQHGARGAVIGRANVGNKAGVKVAVASPTEGVGVAVCRLIRHRLMVSRHVLPRHFEGSPHINSGCGGIEDRVGVIDKVGVTVGVLVCVGVTVGVGVLVGVGVEVLVGVGVEVLVGVGVGVEVKVGVRVGVGVFVGVGVAVRVGVGVGVTAGVAELHNASAADTAP
jgi:hypothetical protein